MSVNSNVPSELTDPPRRTLDGLLVPESVMSILDEYHAVSPEMKAVFLEIRDSPALQGFDLKSYGLVNTIELNNDLP